MLRAALSTCVAVAAAATVLAGCGDDALDADGYRTKAAGACAGVHAGAAALTADGRPPKRRVDQALDATTGAVRRLSAAQPPGELADAHEELMRALQSQAARLRAVRDQMQRGSDPARVLNGARAGLDDADARTGERLRAAGVDCAALVTTAPEP